MFIYKITNLVNGKIYIGQTINSVESRWKAHCRKNSHCLYLKNAINKYGKENFKIDILEKCTSLEELNNKEIKYIQDNNCVFPLGYNLTSGSNNFLHNEITKKVMSEKAKNRRHSTETKSKLSKYWKNKRIGKDNGLYKPILCVTNNTKYESQREAAKILNLYQANINKVLQGKRTHTGGFVFIYAEEK